MININNINASNFKEISNVYDVFELSKSKDIFDELIVNIINEKYCDIKIAKQYIKTVEKRNKKYATISHLGDNKVIWEDLRNNLHEDNSFKTMNKIHDIIFNYIKYEPSEIKNESIIKTPHNKLVIPMIGLIDEYDSSFWTNPYHKVFDPCGGSGSTLIIAIDKFMDGLKNIITDKEDRYKWIIENCIYYSDSNIKNCFAWISIVDIYNKLKTNTYWGDFLEEDFDIHMKEVWQIDSFDLIIQDPPFKQISKNTKHYSDYYPKFIEKSHSISKKTISTSPIKWFSKIKNKSFRDKMINNFGLRIINTIKDDDIYDNFKLRGGVCYFLLDKNSDTKEKVLFDKKLVDITKYEIIPNDLSKTSISIIDKVINKKNITHRLNANLHFNITTNDNRLKETGMYKCHVSKYKGNVKYISDIDLRLKKVDKWKLLIPNTTNSGGMRKEYYNRMVIAKPGELSSQSFIFFDFDTEEELLIFKKYLESEIVSYLVRLRKVKQHVNSDVFKWVPDINLKQIKEDINIEDIDENYFREILDIPKNIDLTIKK